MLTAGPYLVAALWLLLGYLQYRTGTPYSLSPDHYRAWAFPAFRYSDLIWLYLRDGLESRPLPYVAYPLEYPPLTGVVSWLLSFAPDLPSYFALSYAVLSVATLGTVWALQRLPDANPWYLAAAPALFFYTGHQWDPLAVGTTALALVAVVRGRFRLGALGLAVGVSLKLFPLAFLAALCADHLRHRRWRRLVETAAIALAVTLAANLPFALANADNWSFFFRWNRDRLADSGIWVLWRGVPTETLTGASMLAAVGGGLAIAAFAYRRGGSLVLPLGATALLWWLFVNKTFTTHLVLWVLLAVAILRPPVWLWLAVVAVDLVGFQVGNYLNLYNVPTYQSAPLIQKAVENIYDPLQIARSMVLLSCVGWGLLAIWQRRSPPLPERQRWSRRRLFRLPRPSVAVPRFDRRSVGAATLLVASYVAATVAMTWPYALHLRGSTVVGFDPLLQIWLSRWVQHALATNPLALWDANIFYPFAKTLAYTDANIPGALLAWPVDLVTRDPILTNSLLTLSTFVIAAAGMYALVLGLTGNRGAAWLAGLAYAFLPWRAVHLWHLNWLQSAWLPWLALACFRLLDRPTVGRAILLGFLGALQVLTSFYFALQIAILLGALLLAALAADQRFRSPATGRALALAAVIAAVLVLPATLPYLAVRAEQGLERTLAETEEYKATPDAYLSLPPWDAPNPIQRLLGVRPGENRSLATVGQAPHADGHRHGEIVIEGALYPGLFAIVGALAALVWWRGPRWPVAALTAIAVTAALLSLGPSLGPIDGSGQPLPYGWLFERVPFFTAMRVPARLGGLVDLALVVLAGVGVAAVWSRWARPAVDRLRPRRTQPAAFGLTGVVGLLILADLAALPAPLEPVGLDDADRAPYEWLATQPPGPVMEFPAESIFADPAAASVRRHVGLSMLGSTIHWRPLVNGNSGFIPRAHTELLEAFVGNAPRPDGSLALRVSRVDRERARLLQALGVRYLVFHRDRYRDDDWPAVTAALAGAEGLIEPAARFPQAEIYRVREPLAPPRTRVTLWAPTLLEPGAPWAPVITVDADASAPLALTRPTRMSVTWFDRDGRLVTRDGHQWSLPAVTPPGRLVCTLLDCLPDADADPLVDLPRPATGLWRPTQPGHYVARIALVGDTPLTCQVDLDVVADETVSSSEIAAPPRWAECSQTGVVPRNDPGRPPFTPIPPSITFAGGSLALQTGLATRDVEEVRAWFLLAPPGDPAPWRTAVYRSPVQQRIVQPGEPATFSWFEQPSALPPGVYGLSLWFHRASDGGWEHAAGGGFGLSNIVVGRDGSLRWAGPIRIARAAPISPLVVGRSSDVPLAVAGTPPGAACVATWVLVDPRTQERLATGFAGHCQEAQLRLPSAVPPGSYRLEIVASTSLATDLPSDGLSVPVTVLGEPERGAPR